MTERTKVWMSWSSGKDSAWALKTLRADPRYEVVGLLTTVNETHERVAMHAVRRQLLHSQAAALGIELQEAMIPHPCSNEIYEQVMRSQVETALEQGVQAIAFGDLFLEDIRQYREDKMEGTGLATLFPIWGLNTRALAEEMIASGMKAVVTALDPKQISARLVGSSFDAEFLAQLPESADPCGENGEFHTFVYDGPGFQRAVPIRLGDSVERGGFHFCDLLFAASEADGFTSLEQT